MAETTHPTETVLKNQIQLVANRLRSSRAQKGWDIGQLATKSNISRTTISLLENGHLPRPRAKTLGKLAAALEISPEELNPCLTADTSHSPSRFLGQPANHSKKSQAFDRVTNPLVSEVFAEIPELFLSWTEEEFDELYSTFGNGGALNRQGVIDLAHAINCKRETVQKLHVLLETHLGEATSQMIDALYQLVRPNDQFLTDHAWKSTSTAPFNRQDPTR